MSDYDPAFENWVQRARDADILAVANSLGAKLKKIGSAEHAGPCPACGGTDRFSLNTRERVFNCRGSGGGDIIAMAQHIRGCEFIDACEIILDEPPPGRGAGAHEPDPSFAKERREERRDDEIRTARADAADLADAIAEATKIFDAALPIAGTWADDYLERRGILIDDGLVADLRFVPGAEYWGYADRDADKLTCLGNFHCMVSAMRDVGGRIIGLHRTYFDNSEPIKLRPPGDRSRNRAKKFFRRHQGALIRLGPIGETLAVGEGIETTLAWRRLADEGYFGEEFLLTPIAAAGSLGNMSGGATGTKPHPLKPRAVIQNGDPDPEKPGFILPVGVQRLILLGDGDSDAAETRAKLLTGAERYRRQGVSVSICMAPTGGDWNDVLLETRRRAA